MTSSPEGVLVARGTVPLEILPRMANRHGLIAGATGTGKTVTLQVIAERFSRLGVPCFLADVKGDLAGVSQPGTDSPKIRERIEKMQLSDFAFGGSPVTFWDLFGEQGHPVRATISDMGPLLLSRLLNLNETQGGVLHAVFKIADDNGMLLLDLKDLRAILEHAATNASQYRARYGNISAASVGAIQRGLLELEAQGAEGFFGEPALELEDMIQTDRDGRGVINILAADRLLQHPKLYATFLLWLLAELFERLPEVGDPEVPKFLFFFDEAHLVFDEAPKPLLEKIQQVTRLIRSKGVGVYYITQNPLDVPDVVLGQLGNRIQHALRAFTPRDQKAVKAAAETFRSNPELDVEKVITEMGVGEALVSFLDAKGTPGVVQRALVCPPFGRIGPIDLEERKSVRRQSIVGTHYDTVLDRESAYELLKERTEERLEQEPRPQPKGRQRMSTTEAVTRSILVAAGSQLGRSVIRGVFGSILGGKRR